MTVIMWKNETHMIKTWVLYSDWEKDYQYDMDMDMDMDTQVL